MGAQPLARVALLLAALAAAALASAAAVSPAGPDTQWSPLTRRRGLRPSSTHKPRPPRRARLLRESAYVLEGSTSLGYYTAPIQLGSPPRIFNLILDTGSSLAVVPCASCDCGNHESLPFNPNASATARALPCSDRGCSLPRQSCDITEPSATCTFYNMYAEGSSSGGAVLRDTLLLPRPGAAPPDVLRDFSFGCAKFQTGQLYTQEADGVLGLSYSSVALPTQLARSRVRPEEPPGSFSICLGARGGAMAVGRAPRGPGAPAMTYVQMVSSGYGYHMLPLLQISVGGTALAVKMDDYGATRDVSGTRVHSIIVDSGATFSYLGRRAHAALAKAVTASLRSTLPGTAGAGGARRLLGAPARSGPAPPPQRPAARAGPGAGAGAGVAGSAARRATAEKGDIRVKRLPSEPDEGDVCWLVAGPGASKVRSEYDLAGIFPDLEVSFLGGAKLAVPPQRYMFVSRRRQQLVAPNYGDGFGGNGTEEEGADGEDGGDSQGPGVVACLGVFYNEEDDDESIIGAAMMRDAVFEFDPFQGQRVGFADANCDSLAAALAPAGKGGR